MTWNKIAEIISEMSSEQQGEVAVYREPYDEPEMFGVDLQKAVEDLSDLDGVVRVKKGAIFITV